jgi:taurine dioxygenase
MSSREFSIIPMHVGAEIAGLRPGAEEDADVRDALYDAWLKYGILLFRGVDSAERHLAVRRCFGELELHPVHEMRLPGNELLVELGGRMRTSVYVFDDGEMRVNRIAWHRDTAYTPDICKGAMLRMLEVPTHDGETMLADTAMAWDELPDDLKRKVEGLEFKATLRTEMLSLGTRPGTFWKSVREATDEEDPNHAQLRAMALGIDERYPSVIHPAVLRHPESGRVCLFLSPTYVDVFLGLSQGESDDLLRRLTDHMLQPRFVYRHKWSPNDAIIWDNRRFMHAGMGNSPDEPRYGQRTTLAGPVRTGRYFDAAAKRPETLIAD